MIFVTVGTYKFDDLIVKIDDLCKSKEIVDEVICQIGCGEYLPQFVSSWFRYQSDLNALIDKATVVIGHGGTGTVISALRHEKRFLAVVNGSLADNHQLEFVSSLSQQGYIDYCTDLGMLMEKLTLVTKRAQPCPIKRCNINYLARDLIDFLG